MLHTKFRGNRPAGFREDLKRVFTIYGHGRHLGHVTSLKRCAIVFVLIELLCWSSLSLSLSLSLSVCLSVSLSLSPVCLSVCLFIHFSSLSLSLSFSLSLSLIFMSFCFNVSFSPAIHKIFLNVHQLARR